MRILRQIYLLLQKDVKLIWRSKLWFLVEMLVGLLMFPLILYIVSKTGNEVSKSAVFDPVRIVGGTQDIQQQIKTIPRVFTKICGKNQTLAYSGQGSASPTLMRKMQERYSGSITIGSKYFETLDSMKTELLNDLNETTESVCGTYLGGVVFENIDFSHHKLKYRILFPRRVEQKWHLDQFWREEGPYSAIADFNSIPGDPPYWSSGFLSVQFAIENAFLALINKTIDFPVYLQRIPSPEFRSTSFLAFLKQVPMFWAIAVLMTIVHTLKNILTEKEVGIKTYMNVMGLDSVAFYGSHFVVGFIKVTFILIVCAGTFSIGLSYVSSTLFVEFSILFGMGAIVFAVLISTIFRKSAIAIAVAIISWIGLMVLDSFYTTSLTNIPHCFLVSLNIYTAFKLGIKSAIMAETSATYLGWTNMFTNSTHSFTFGFATIMLIFDIVLMILISLYLDAVWPTDDSPRRSPFFIFGYKSHSGSRFDVSQDEVDAPEENVEPDSVINRDEADIDVRRMSKIWETTGQMAVDNVSFRAYRGQVTVLLGHNGAGKSTTFSVISGSTTVTGGNVYICGEDIQSKLSNCQQKIGYCPQYNPLFNRLTVREHLALYARLKTMGPSTNLKNEIEAIAQQVQLKPKLDELAENLSGGMKRKLCVGMALIGESRVILLDEPTAGMDPQARNDVKTLLEKTKKNRTILLTTHYMDEADLLGDRIGIMVKGRMVCNGSSEFLKNRFGTGYVLSVVVVYDEKICKSFNGVVDKILKVTHKHAPEARVDSISIPEFSIILPIHQKTYFADLFEELEARKDELNILSFGLSFNTLEQVFLRVGEIAEASKDHIAVENACENTASLFTNEPQYTGPQLYFNQIAAMLQRHFLNLLRNKARTITPVIVSLLLFGLFVGSGRFNSSFQSEQLDLSLNKLEPLSIPVAMSQSATAKLGIPFIIGQVENMESISISSKSNLTSVLMERAAHESPPLGIGASLMSNNTVLALFNGASFHGPPSALLLITNAMINETPDAIQLGIEIYDISPVISSESPESNLIVAIIVILAFSLLTSTFLMPLVEENQSRFKHQLLLTKMNTLTYWISYIIWHVFIYVCFCILLCLIFLIFGWMKGSFMPTLFLWTLYLWCCLPFVYCASFIFQSAVKGYTAILCWNFIVSLLALIVDVVLMALEVKFINAYHNLTFIILPSYSLGSGMVQIAIHSGIESLPTSFVYDAISQIYWCCFFSGCIFWTLLFVMESKKVSQYWHNIQCRIRKNPYQIINGDLETNEDEDVLRERESMRRLGDENFALAVREVYKYYGRFCAVKNLTFGVKQTDCFGLLGVNGAGKTSTFNIITNETYANSGRATIQGVDVAESPVIGYCPQFDALAGDLTGRELLTLLGKLNGFRRVNERVLNVLENICMIGKANNLVQFYSGGQKRRLSIGATLMAKTGLIILDEPTAGIDPSTRRKIWQLLTAVRQHNVAILLTSHSMDECEALCNRIGFMNKGSLISIGSSQHLKSRYSTYFLLSYTLANPSKFSVSYLDSLVTREFDAKSTTDPPTMATQHWEIPRTNQSWSDMFRRAQRIAEKHPVIVLPLGSERPLIKDFSLTQSSLEQVFLRLSEDSHEP